MGGCAFIISGGACRAPALESAIDPGQMSTARLSLQGHFERGGQARPRYLIYATTCHCGTHANEPVLLSVLLRMLPPFLMLPLPLRSLWPLRSLLPLPLPPPPPPPLVMLGSLHAVRGERVVAGSCEA